VTLATLEMALDRLVHDPEWPDEIWQGCRDHYSRARPDAGIADIALDLLVFSRVMPFSSYWSERGYWVAVAQVLARHLLRHEQHPAHYATGCLFSAPPAWLRQARELYHSQTEELEREFAAQSDARLQSAPSPQAVPLPSSCGESPLEKESLADAAANEPADQKARNPRTAVAS
jgi:hypothetical protein